MISSGCIFCSTNFWADNTKYFSTPKVVYISNVWILTPCHLPDACIAWFVPDKPLDNVIKITSVMPSFLYDSNKASISPNGGMLVWGIKPLSKNEFNSSTVKSTPSKYVLSSIWTCKGKKSIPKSFASCFVNPQPLSVNTRIFIKTLLL